MTTMESVNLALLDAYRDEEELERAVRYGLDVSLPEVASGRDFTATVFRLTDWAARSGVLADLVKAAKEDRPHNPKIQALSVSGNEQVELQEERSEAVVGNLELIEYRLGLLDDEVKETQRLSRENARKIDRLQDMAGRSPDLLGTRSARILFTAIFILLILIFGVIVADSVFVA